MINNKQNRFNQLLGSLEDANPKTLSARLKEMEKLGLIKRKVYPNETPIRVELSSNGESSSSRGQS